METAHIFLCDDQPSFTESFRSALSSLLKMPHTISAFTCGESLLFAILDTPCNILFLDIELPGDNGIEVARKIRKTRPDLPIILVSHYEQYLPDGYGISATQFLTKPVDEKKLSGALNKATHQMERHRKRFYTVESQGNHQNICVDDILYISREGRHSVLYTEEATFPLTVGIQDIEDLNWPFFFRVDKGILLNIAHILRTDGNQRTALMRNGQWLPVARRREKAFRSFLLQEDRT